MAASNSTVSEILQDRDVNQDYYHGTIIDYVRECFPLVRLSLFFGGFGKWQSQTAQLTYEAVFLLGYSTCCIVCATNMYYQTAPFYDISLGLATVYVHVLGLHLFFYWRTHKDNDDFRKLSSVVLGSKKMEKLRSRLSRHLQVFAFLSCIGQFVMTVLGYAAFCGPSLATASETEWSTPSAHFTVLHSSTMFIMIPVHVPAIVMGIGVVWLESRLHIADAERAQAVITDMSNSLIKISTGSMPKPLDDDGDLDLDKELIICCELAQTVQGRVDAWSRSFKWLWLHVALYAVVTFTIVVSHIRVLMRKGNLSDLDPYTQCRFLWHILLAFYMVAGILIPPASITDFFKGYPPRIMLAMRLRGASLAHVTDMGSFLNAVTSGFRVFDFCIDLVFVYKCMLIASVLSGFYLSDYHGMY